MYFAGLYIIWIKYLENVYTHTYVHSIYLVSNMLVGWNK